LRCQRVAAGTRQVTWLAGSGRGVHVYVAARSPVLVGADELLVLGGALIPAYVRRAEGGGVGLSAWESE